MSVMVSFMVSTDYDIKDSAMPVTVISLSVRVFGPINIIIFSGYGLKDKKLHVVSQPDTQMQYGSVSKLPDFRS